MFAEVGYRILDGVLQLHVEVLHVCPWRSSGMGLYIECVNPHFLFIESFRLPDSKAFALNNEDENI